MIIINTPALSNYISVVTWYLNHGKRWAGGSTNLNRFIWANFESDTCIMIRGKIITFSGIDHIHEHYDVRIRDMSFFYDYTAKISIKKFKRRFNLR